VLQEQKSHPLPGVISSNFQVSYNLSRIVTSAGGASADQFFAGAIPWDNDDPNRFLGRSNLDHTNELSFGGSIAVRYGIQVGAIGHFFSAPPATLTLDTGGSAEAQIFITDVNGDGYTGGAIVPGTNPGYYEHQIKGGSLNQLITNYNQTQAGTLTPAGQALVSAGLFTSAQLSALGAVKESLAPAPTSPLNNPMLRTFDMNLTYPIKFTKFREGLQITPGVAMYNVFNMSNFGQFGGTLLNTADAGTPGYLNGPNDQATLNSIRTTRNSGTFDQGGPRTTEFQLKLNF
jgi:hypothetical protein